MKPCQSRFDLYKEHCGVDLQAMFPNDESKYDKAETDKWTWDLYLDCAQKLHKAGFPVGLPMGQASDAVDWVGALFASYGVVMVDAKDNIKVNSNETRQALEYMKKLMAASEGLAFDTASGRVTMRGRQVDKDMYLASCKGTDFEVIKTIKGVASGTACKA